MSASEKGDPAKQSESVRFGALLLHPLALGGLALLLLNDWVLKPNVAITSNQVGAIAVGKLSDIAGLVIGPLVLATVLFALIPAAHHRRRWRWVIAASLAAIVLPFIASKTSSSMSGWLAETLASLPGLGGSRIVCDPTDLLTLPAAVLPVVVVRSTWSASAS